VFPTQRFGRIIWSLVAAMGLSLAGCTGMRDYVHNGFKVGPDYCPPAGPVAGHWIDAYDSHLRGDTGGLCRWWTVFRDPTLNQLIAHACRQNISLKEAGFRILEARAQRGIAAGGLFPQSQTATGGAERVALPVDQVTPGFPRFYNLYGAGFNLAWQLDFWGQFRRAVEAADAQLDASVAGYDEVLITLLAAVAENYVEIRSDQQQIEVLKRNANEERVALEAAMEQFKAKKVTYMDPGQIGGLIKQVESEIPPLKADMRQANDRLCVLLGLAPEDLVKCLGTAPIPTAPATVAVGIPAQLLTRRPDIRQAERTAAAQSAEIGVAVSQAYPMVSISGTLGWQSQQLAQLFTPSGFNGTIGPTFQWNILNYGRLLNNDRLQQARFRELVAAYQQTVLQAQSEVENGLAAFLQAQEQVATLEGSVAETKKVVAIAMSQWGLVNTDWNRLSVLLQNLVDREVLLAQARGAIAQGLIQTYLALGGGWEIRCAPQESFQPLGPIVPAAEVPAEPIMPPSSSQPPEILPAPVP
jgi:NodT family efflux transporter outer membrane factor (OMF) lipoprotein